MGVYYTASFARPFRLRARNTRVPDFVFVRARKPCVVARFFFFG